MKHCLRVPSFAAGPLRTCCVVITGGSLALIDRVSKVDEEQDISQSVPPASLLSMTQRCTVTIGHYIIAVMHWSV